MLKGMVVAYYATAFTSCRMILNFEVALLVPELKGYGSPKVQSSNVPSIKFDSTLWKSRKTYYDILKFNFTIKNFTGNDKGNSTKVYRMKCFTSSGYASVAAGLMYCSLLARHH
jgi:hypothetical protein